MIQKQKFENCIKHHKTDKLGWDTQQMQTHLGILITSHSDLYFPHSSDSGFSWSHLFQRLQIILVSEMLHKTGSVSSLSAHRLGPTALQWLTHPSNPLSHSLYQLRSSQVLLNHALQLQLTQFHITKGFPSCLWVRFQQYCRNNYKIHPFQCGSCLKVTQLLWPL